MRYGHRAIPIINIYICIIIYQSNKGIQRAQCYKSDSCKEQYALASLITLLTNVCPSPIDWFRINTNSNNTMFRLLVHTFSYFFRWFNAHVCLWSRIKTLAKLSWWAKMPPVASVEPLAFSVVSKKWVLRYRPLLISPEICVIIMRRYIFKTIIMLVTVLLLNGHILSYLIISYLIYKWVELHIPCMHHAPCTQGEKMPSTPCRPLRCRVTRRSPVALRDQGIDPRESSRPSLDGHQKRIQTCVLSQISSGWFNGLV